jgi:hypothetical protein
VGTRAYHRRTWRLEEELTEEHRFAARHGILAILEIERPDDERLRPFCVEVEGVEISTAPSLEALYEESQGLRRLLVMSESRIVPLELKVLELEEMNQQQSEVILGLRAQVAVLEARLQEVAASVVAPASRKVAERG